MIEADISPQRSQKEQEKRYLMDSNSSHSASVNCAYLNNNNDTENARELKTDMTAGTEK
jgi:hypothetical protein